MNSILLFTSLFAIPLARKGCLDATLLTGLQVVGVTLDFLDNVLRLYLPLKPADDNRVLIRNQDVLFLWVSRNGLVTALSILLNWMCEAKWLFPQEKAN
jgi:hypothetical protein